MNNFPTLFSPLTIGSLTLDNRICFAAASSELADHEGHATPEMAEYYAERARGGAGLIVVEATYIEQEGKRLPHNAMLHEDRFIPGMHLVAEAVHRTGRKVMLQLNHGGREAVTAVSGSVPLGPSAVPSKFTGGGSVSVPRALTRGEIERIITRFAEAAKRAQQAGFDGVEIHAAHGYLISQFLSPDANIRDDEYGGDTQGRSRFLVEIIQAVKRYTEDDYPVIARFNSSDHISGGLQLKHALEIARYVEEAGADSISISAGIHASRPYAIIPGMASEHAWNREASAMIKSVVTIPVMLAGRISTPEIAEDLLASGDIDVVCMSRALIADPYFPAKALTGKTDEIIPCIACNECVANIHNHNGVACTVNPFVSRELELRLLLESRPAARRVAIIGAGAAGLSAAIVAAKRGHEVHLFEQACVLGGQLNLAHQPPHRGEIERILTYYTREVARLGLSLHLGRKPSPDDVRAIEPDVIIMAIGARSVAPEIPSTGCQLMTGWKVLAGLETPGGSCVVVGGGLVGIEVADFLAGQGKTPVIVARSDILKKAVHADRVHYEDSLKEQGIEVLQHAQIGQIGEDWVDVNMAGGGMRRLASIDTVIFCTGYEAQLDDCRQFEALGSPVYHVGDVLGSRKFFEAIKEGAMAALSIQ